MGTGPSKESGMTIYQYATDGMLYHASQVTVDEGGRWHAKPGAQCGLIAREDEFGQTPELTDTAAALLKAWNAGKPPTPAPAAAAAPDDPATYATKVVTPAVPTPDVLTKEAHAEPLPRAWDGGGRERGK